VRGGHNPLERPPAVGAEALEASELGLDRDAGGARRLDQAETAFADGLGPRLAGVEAEAYLALTLAYERGQAIGERGAQLG
jgi:hypothetical protein